MLSNDSYYVLYMLSPIVDLTSLKEHLHSGSVDVFFLSIKYILY